MPGIDVIRREIERMRNRVNRQRAEITQLRHAGISTTSAEELLDRVWDEMADPFTTSVKVTISRLRRKLGDPPVIETVAQAGYRIRE